MKIFSAILFLVFFLSFCQDRKQSPHVKQAYQEIKKFKKKAFEKYGVTLIGQGGAFMDQINELDLTFYIKKEQSLNEMRELIINLSCDFLKQINSNNKIKKHISEHPFNVKNLDLDVLVFDLNKNFIINSGSNKEKIASGILKKNKIYYTIKNEERENLQVIYQETFQEALEKVQEPQTQLNK